jgi:hypothetical protein
MESAMMTLMLGLTLALEKDLHLLQTSTANPPEPLDAKENLFPGSHVPLQSHLLLKLA